MEAAGVGSAIGGQIIEAIVSRLIDRLIASYHLTGGESPATELANAIRAVELHGASFDTSRDRLRDLLTELGICAGDAESLSESEILASAMVCV